jgi:GTPase SAR1 family protein
MIVNIRGTSGSGKSTLVKRLMSEYFSSPVIGQLPGWKKARVLGYTVQAGEGETPTFIVGSYETKCGGCDSISYKGSMDDIEALVREAAGKGYNVIFEGLVVTSTINRWMEVADDFPGKYLWAFMMTTEEECHRRIVARNGREPKRKGPRQIADYNIKYAASMHHKQMMEAQGRPFILLESDEESYQRLKSALSYS